MNFVQSLDSDETSTNYGNVIGVSELAINARESMISAPVLVSDVALVFLAWQEDSKIN